MEEGIHHVILLLHEDWAKRRKNVSTSVVTTIS